MNIHEIATPAYVLEEEKLRKNLAVLDRVQREGGVSILLALKGFAFWSAFPIIRETLKGTTASSLHEALLGSEEMGGETHVYAPAYTEVEFPGILKVADHIVFNSFSQWDRFRDQCLAAGGGKSFGIRVNPEYSEIRTPLYDPCAPHSRLGVTESEFHSERLEGLSGLHFHSHCGSDAEALARGWAHFDERFGAHLEKMRWVNLGGGHHITRSDYNIELLIELLKGIRTKYPHLRVYLEPGEAVGWQTGPLVTSVLDIVRNRMDIAMLDCSASAHMPDCLEMPYRPDIRGAREPGELPHTYRLGGLTCLAGDVIGDYSFSEPLQVGDKLVIEDMIHYTIVKNNTFNGVRLPDIGIWTSEGRYRLVKRFGYEDYKNRLS